MVVLPSFDASKPLLRLKKTPRISPTESYWLATTIWMHFMFNALMTVLDLTVTGRLDSECTNSQSLTMSVLVGFAVVGDADGMDDAGRALVGIAVIHWVGLYVAEGILVGFEVFVGFAVVGDADGFDDVGRALVGMAVIHWVGLYVAEGILVGFDVFVGAGVVGIKVCTLVGAAVGPMVFG